MTRSTESKPRAATGLRLRAVIAPFLLFPLALVMPAGASEAAQAAQEAPALNQSAAPQTSQTPAQPRAAAGSLTMDVPSPTRWRPGAAIPIGVGTKALAVRNLTVASAPFAKSETSDPLQLTFCLAKTPEGTCGPQSVARDSYKQFWLIGSGSAEAGTYEGTVRLLGAGGAEAIKPLTIAVTTRVWQVWGLGALLAGVLLSFLLSVWMPHQRRRDLAIRPFALLAERLRESQARLPEGEAPAVRDKAKAVQAELALTRLQAHGLVPGVSPSAAAAADPGDELKKYFDAAQAKVAALEILVAAIGRTTDAAKRTALNALAAATDFPQPNLAAQIDAILVGPAFAAARRAAATMPTPAELVTREEARNLLFWFVSSVISVAVGYVLLVDANPSFGGWKDVVAVFLWGLGLSTTGAKLSDLTQAQIRTGLRPA